MIILVLQGLAFLSIGVWALVDTIQQHWSVWESPGPYLIAVGLLEAVWSTWIGMKEGFWP